MIDLVLSRHDGRNAVAGVQGSNVVRRTRSAARAGREPVRALYWSSGARPDRRDSLAAVLRRPGLACHVTEIAGVESEIEMPFAACISCAGRCSGNFHCCHAPQQQALQVAFGLATGGAPDLFVIGLAALGLLADPADERGDVCVSSTTPMARRTSSASSGSSATFLTKQILSFTVQKTSNGPAASSVAGA